MVSLLGMLVLFQVPINSTRSLEELELRAKAQASYAKKHLDAAEAEERIDFAEQYDRLVKAMQKFEREYRQGEGLVWPKRSADELERAMRGFQSTAAWKQHGKLARK